MASKVIITKPKNSSQPKASKSSSSSSSSRSITISAPRPQKAKEPKASSLNPELIAYVRFMKYSSEVAKKILMSRLDPTHWYFPNIPPGLGKLAASYQDPVVFEGMKDPQGDFMVVAFQRPLRQWYLTAGRTVAETLNTSESPGNPRFSFRMHYDTLVALSGFLDFLNSGVYPRKVPEIPFPLYPFNFTTSTATLHCKFVSAETVPHTMTYTYIVYNAAYAEVAQNGGVVKTGDTDFLIDFTFAANTQYYFALYFESVYPTTTIISGILYTESAKVLTLPNHFTTCLVSDWQTKCGDNRECMVYEQTVHFMNTSSALNCGGQIASARVDPHFRVTGNSTLYQTISNYPIKGWTRTGKSQDGSYSWGNQGYEEYVLRAIADPRSDLSFQIHTGHLDPEFTYQVLCQSTIIHAGQDKGYNYMDPVNVNDWITYNNLFLQAAAVTSNDEHRTYLRRAAQRIGEVFKNPDTWSRVGHGVATAGKLLATMFL